MLIAVRNIQCPLCGFKYKVEARSIILFFALIVVGAYSIKPLSIALPAYYSWVACIIILLSLFALAPLNQKLEIINADKNS